MAGYLTVPEAVHFNVLGVCRPNGRELLKTEGGADPPCVDDGGRSRAEIRAELSRLVATARQRTSR